MRGLCLQLKMSTGGSLVLTSLLGALILSSSGCFCGPSCDFNLFPDHGVPDVGQMPDIDPDSGPDMADMADMAAPKATVRIIWRINADVDSAPTSPGIDDCHEVGAKTLSLRLHSPAGQRVEVPCAGGPSGVKTTQVEVNANAKFEVFATLFGEDGHPITRTIPLALPGLAKEGEQTLHLTFYYDDFKTRRIGKLNFATRFGGLLCSELAQPLEQLTLVGMATSLPPASDPTGRQVCYAATSADAGSASTCIDADGVTAHPCTDQTFTMEPLVWGYYLLRVEARQASTPPATAPICWRFEDEVLVGAGDNPVIQLDLAKVQSAACGQTSDAGP